MRRDATRPIRSCRGRRVDEEETPAGLGVTVGNLVGGCGLTLGAGVGDLYAEDGPVRSEGETEVEVAAGDVAVADGVRGEFGRDEGQGLVGGGRVGVAPFVQAVGDQTSG